MRKRRTHSLDEDNYEKFEAHCRLTGKVPSRVVDILIADFLDEIKNK